MRRGRLVQESYRKVYKELGSIIIVKNTSSTCRIQTSSGKEFKIFVPSSTNHKQTDRIISNLGEHFDLVISAPAEYKVGYGDNSDFKGVEITAIRKNQARSDIEFSDISRVLALVWPDKQKANRPILRGTTDNIVIHELHCESEPEDVGSAQER